MKSAEDIRKIFEETFNSQKGLEPFNFAPLIVNDKFMKYMDPDTDNAWIGFGLGYRLGQRHKENELNYHRTRIG